MKTIYKSLTAAALALPMMMSSCIEETFPTSGFTTEQIQGNSLAIESTLRGMPAYMKKIQVWTSHGFDFGYPAMMIMNNCLTNDMFESPTGYDWFSSWLEASENLNSGYVLSQVTWYYYNFLVNSTNEAISVTRNSIDTPFGKGAYAQALLYRVNAYLEMARIFEWLPTAAVPSFSGAGNDVTGLTVPIVTPDTPDDQRANNPRATHDQMVKFLLDDVNLAIDLYQQGGTQPTDKQFPGLAVAYGLKARILMWDEKYPQAAEAAQMAINSTAAAPTTRDQWLSTTNGFNDSSVPSWLWCIQFESNDDATQSWTNWTSFMSPELWIGYGGGGSGSGDTYWMMDRQMYDRISNSDWRKLTFKAPAGHPLEGQTPALNAERFAALTDYACVKFRPGSGNMNDEPTAFATAVPLMRIEEMYFIKAEAEAHTSPAVGKQTLESFMKQYRYPQYSCTATGSEDVIEEIIFQKRVEFFGEGIIFYDWKRLGYGIDRAYDGTNWPDAERYVVEGRPAWMNRPFVDYEGEFNQGVRGYENPNTGGVYKPVFN